jgi:hypothetical protein
MHTQVMKWFSMAALLLTTLCWNASANGQLELGLVLCAATGMVLTLAFQANKYRAAGVFAIALRHNPLLPFHSPETPAYPSFS